MRRPAVFLRRAASPSTPRLAAPLAAGLVAAGLVAGLALERAAAPARARPAVAALAPAAQVAPRSQRAFDEARLWLPALDALHGTETCWSWIQVQNLGDEAAQALLLAFAAPDGCALPNGPLSAECSGLIAPAQSWSLFGYQVPTGSHGAVLLSASTGPLRALNPEAPSDRTVGMWLCERGFFDTVGNAEAFAALMAGWRPGGTLLGLPADGVVGPPLAAVVHRYCASGPAESMGIQSAYAVPADADLGAPRGGAWRQVLPSVHHAPAGAGASVILVQNAGAECAEAVVELVPDGGCAPVATCAVGDIEPGESAAVDLAACAAAGFHGAAFVSASQPVAVVVDTLLDGGLMSYAGAAEAARPADAPGAVAVADRRGGHALLQGAPGADVTLRLAAPRGGGSWRVTTRDEDGNPLDERTLSVCAGGVAMETLPAGAGDGAGSVVVEPVGDAGPDAIGALERVAWQAPGTTASEAHGEVLAARPPGGAAGVVALPFVLRDRWMSGLVGELAVANLEPEAAQLAVGFFDANGLVDVACAALGPSGVVRFDLGAGPPPAVDGFSGSAVVRALPAEGGAPAIDAAMLVRNAYAGSGEEPSTERGSVTGVRLSPAAAARLADWGLADPCGRDVGPLAPAVPPPLPGDLPSPAARRTGAVLALPALTYLGFDNLCDAEIAVLNDGAEPARILMIEFGEPGFCAPQCAGPEGAYCLEPLSPGARHEFVRSWREQGGVVNALVVSLTTRRLSELGLALPGVEGDPPLADVICARAESMVDDCDRFDALRSAMRAEGTWEGIPMDRALGPAITASVLRTCFPTRTGPPATDGYDAPAELAAVSPFAPEGPFGYALPLAYAGVPTAPLEGPIGGQLQTTLYVQNLGSACTTVDGMLRAPGECAEVRGCSIAALAPGEMYALDVSDCVPEGWQGSVALRSGQPLAVVAEHRTVAPDGSERLRALPARVGFDPFDVDLDGAVTGADEARVRMAVGRVATDPDWDERDDLDGDGAVDGDDVALVAAHRCDAPDGGRVFAPFAYMGR